MLYQHWKRNERLLNLNPFIEDVLAFVLILQAVVNSLIERNGTEIERKRSKICRREQLISWSAIKSGMCHGTRGINNLPQTTRIIKRDIFGKY